MAAVCLKSVAGEDLATAKEMAPVFFYNSASNDRVRGKQSEINVYLGFCTAGFCSKAHCLPTDPVRALQGQQGGIV